MSLYTARPAHDLHFSHIARSKPILTDFPELFFNLSHSSNRALLAITTTAPVGVDIELNRELNDCQALIKRNFSPVEQRALTQLARHEVLSAFYRVWTRKEAVIKSHGLGLGIALESFDVPCGALPLWQQACIRDTTVTNPYCQLREVDTAAGFTGAVALHTSQADAVALRRRDYIV